MKRFLLLVGLALVVPIIGTWLAPKLSVRAVRRKP